MGILHMMELLLNCFWLTLALPALWIWRHERRSAGISGHPYRQRSLVLLGCLLAMLFPMVSATDDLCAMRLVMEESGPGKSTVKQSGGAKFRVWAGSSGSPAHPVRRISLKPENEPCGSPSMSPLSVSLQAPANATGSRAPPY